MLLTNLLILSIFYSLYLQLQDTETTSGESEVKFQVSRDTLGAMLRSMAYIREQLSNAVSIFHYNYCPFLIKEADEFDKASMNKDLK